MKNAALIVSGLIFLCVSIVHFIRFHQNWNIVADNFSVPLDWSLYGGIFTLILAIWMFIAARR